MLSEQTVANNTERPIEIHYISERRLKFIWMGTSTRGLRSDSSMYPNINTGGRIESKLFNQGQ